MVCCVNVLFGCDVCAQLTMATTGCPLCGKVMSIKNLFQFMLSLLLLLMTWRCKEPYIDLVYREYSGFNTTCFNSNIFSSNVFFQIHSLIYFFLSFISWIHLNSFGLGVPVSKLNKIENLRIYRVKDIYWNQLFAFVSENDDGDTNKNLVPLGRE